MTASPASAGIIMDPGQRATSRTGRVYDLSTLWRGGRDFLSFFDETKEIVYSYLYHRTGSQAAAFALLAEVYLVCLARALSLWWFGSLSLKLALALADDVLRSSVPKSQADLDRVYLPALELNERERKAVASLHETLWTLPDSDQRLLTLSILVGLTEERIAGVQGMEPAQVRAALAAARKTLLDRWEPGEKMSSVLSSVVFIPGLDLTQEDTLRYRIIEKYNGLKLRRYQWLVVGGLFAVLSNVIVASVLAMVVVQTPPLSLPSTQRQLSAIRPLTTQRPLSKTVAQQKYVALQTTADCLSAHAVARNMFNATLSVAAEALQQQQGDEHQIDRTLQLLSTPAVGIGQPARAVACR